MMVALLVTGKETARGHAEISVTAAGNKRLMDGSPEMIAIDALAVDDVDFARKDNLDSDSEEDSSEESIMESQLASATPNHSHMAYAPEFDQFSRGVSVTPELFIGEGAEPLTPTVRGDRVFVYKFLGQVDFLAGDRHVDRFQAMLKSGPRAVVIALQNVPR